MGTKRANERQITKYDSDSDNDNDDANHQESSSAAAAMMLASQEKLKGRRILRVPKSHSTNVKSTTTTTTTATSDAASMSNNPFAEVNLGGTSAPSSSSSFSFATPTTKQNNLVNRLSNAALNNNNAKDNKDTDNDEAALSFEKQRQALVKERDCRIAQVLRDFDDKMASLTMEQQQRQDRYNA